MSVNSFTTHQHANSHTKQKLHTSHTSHPLHSHAHDVRFTRLSRRRPDERRSRAGPSQGRSACSPRSGPATVLSEHGRAWRTTRRLAPSAKGAPLPGLGSCCWPRLWRQLEELIGPAVLRAPALPLPGRTASCSRPDTRRLARSSPSKSSRSRMRTNRSARRRCGRCGSSRCAAFLLGRPVPQRAGRAHSAAWAARAARAVEHPRGPRPCRRMPIRGHRRCAALTKLWRLPHSS